MSLINIEQIDADARAAIAQEVAVKATTALIAAYRKREAAQQVARNIEAEISDLKASIADGSFR